jgi:hypothetical protein
VTLGKSYELFDPHFDEPGLNDLIGSLPYLKTQPRSFKVIQDPVILDPGIESGEFYQLTTWGPG